MRTEDDNSGAGLATSLEVFTSQLTSRSDVAGALYDLLFPQVAPAPVLFDAARRLAVAARHTWKGRRVGVGWRVAMAGIQRIAARCALCRCGYVACNHQELPPPPPSILVSYTVYCSVMVQYRAARPRVRRAAKRCTGLTEDSLR